MTHALAAVATILGIVAPLAPMAWAQNTAGEAATRPLSGANIDRAVAGLYVGAPQGGTPAECQVHAILELTQCVSVGEPVRVKTAGGKRRIVAGKFLGYVDDRIAVEVMGAFRRRHTETFADVDVVEIAVMRKSSRTGAVVKGALAFGAATALLSIGPNDSEEAQRTLGTRVAGAAALGALVGAALGYVVGGERQPHVVLTR